MTQGASFRGQPLLLLGGLVLAWLALRLALWQPLQQTGPMPVPLASRPSAPAPAAAAAAGEGRQEVPPATPWLPNPLPRVEWRVPDPLPPPVERMVPEPLAPLEWMTEYSTAPRASGSLGTTPLPKASAPVVRTVVGHNLLLAAGLSQMEIPPALMAYLQGSIRPGVPAAAPVLALPAGSPTRQTSRWSADGWLLLRNDTTTPFLSGRPSYGRSQAGAVIRFRLVPTSPLRPEVYLRASSALAGAREQEVSGGVSARPLAGIPLRLAVEARVSETVLGTEIRPAAYAVSELPPLDLPFRVRGEAYVQGGYVGGRFGTAFVDGQARVDRPLARVGSTELSAGAGAWGGAQKGAARLDIGPTAAVSFRLGDARGRIAADYRFRVAGDAEPSSGPALTVSAGF